MNGMESNVFIYGDRIAMITSSENLIGIISPTDILRNIQKNVTEKIEKYF